MGVVPDIVVKEGDFELAHRMAKAEMDAFDSLPKDQRDKINFSDNQFSIVPPVTHMNVMLKNGYIPSLKDGFVKKKKKV